jgi:hypothetical protein
VGVRLADQYRSRLCEFYGDGGAVAGDVVFEEGRAHRGADILGVDEILEAERDPVQRTPVASGRYLIFGPRRLLQRLLRQHRDKGVQISVLGLDALQECSDDLDRGESPLSKRPGKIRQ